MKKDAYLMNEGWLFYRGDYPLESLKEASPTCYASKSEAGRGPAAYAFLDESWEKVTLPHDYVVLQTADPSENAAHGYLHRGPAWYRRYFELDPQDLGKRIKLLFEGVATNCTVWINGHLMKRHFTGFEDFELDISEVVNYGEATNVIALRVDTQLYDNEIEAFEGWWYDGAGIYRNVWLEKLPALHVSRYGLQIQTKPILANWLQGQEPSLEQGSGEEDLNLETWENQVAVNLVNEAYELKEVEVKLTLLDATGKALVTQIESIQLQGLSSQTIKFNSVISQIKLWEIDQPYLYKVSVELREKGKITERESVHYGYRSLGLDPERGFLLNGKPVKIKGTSNHQDHGALGVAVPDNIMRWRIGLLKQMGCNAYRCAHHTVAPALLDACDELGLLVMSENRWFNTDEATLAGIWRMVKREAHHPSVIMWSVGNEEPIQCEAKGKRIATKLIQTIKQLDDTRPCTLAMNGGFFEKQAIEACDVIGMNYFPWLYDEVHALYPHKVIVATEAACSNNCRGVYEADEAQNRFTAYDQHAPSFGSNHRKAWEAVAKRSFVAGLFYWTGFEYRGETKWPSLFAEVGMIDSNGFKKDNFYLMQALWKETPIVHILPHWSLQKGKKDVWVYSNGESVELFLDGESLGEQLVPEDRKVEWKVEFKPGCLKAVAKRAGQVIGEDVVESCEEVEALHLELANPEVRANGEEVAVLTVSVRDEEGRTVPYARNQVHLKFKGDCIYLGSGASPLDPSEVTSLTRCLYGGLLQVYVRVGKSGQFEVEASSVGLEKAHLSLALKPEPGHIYIKPGKPELIIKKWWSSVVFDTPRTPENFIHRMPAEPGQPIPLFRMKSGYAMLSVVTNVPYYTANKRVGLYFEGITGEAKIWVRRRVCERMQRGQMDLMKENSKDQAQKLEACSQTCPMPCEVYYEKTEFQRDSVMLDLPKCFFKPNETITIWVGVKGEQASCGLTGLVKWMVLEEQRGDIDDME